MVVEATITKSELAKCAAMYGKRNADEYHGAKPGTLTYRTFIGAMDLESRALVGAHHFDVVSPAADAETIKFSSLPGATKEGKKCLS